MKFIVVMVTIAFFLSVKSISAEQASSSSEFVYEGTWEIEGQINRKGYLEITNCEINVE